jgi:hypothetical protein
MATALPAGAPDDARRPATLDVAYALGIDPATTTRLSIDVDPGGKFVARWDSQMVLSDAQREAVSEILGRVHR